MQALLNRGIVELLMTSDNKNGLSFGLVEGGGCLQESKVRCGLCLGQLMKCTLRIGAVRSVAKLQPYRRSASGKSCSPRGGTLRWAEQTQFLPREVWYFLQHKV